MLKKAIWSGVVAGIILGLFLKAIEKMTGSKVYILLLNIDYVPVLNKFVFPEIIEFSLHLMISVGLSIFLALFLINKIWKREKRISFTVLVSVIVGVVLYPTTMLSERTPLISDGSAWAYWLIGHTIYGFVLGYMLRKPNK